MLIEYLPEIESSVCENTNYRDTKSLIQAWNSIFSDDFFTAIKKPVELSLSFRFSDIGAKSGSGEVERINEDQAEATSDTSWQERSNKVLPPVSDWIYSL